MPVYFIANIRVNDHPGYRKYLEKSSEVFDRYGGRYLVVDENPVVLEGSWDYTKAVLIEFDTRENFDKWYHSADYQEILRFRLAASECDTILIEGIKDLK